jgi:hypothetical protein
MSVQASLVRTVLLAIILITSLMLTASAACPETKLNVPLSNVIIDNPGTLTPGTGVVMSVRVDFPDKENTTYPATSQLELTSGLDAPAWTWNIVREGIKRPEIEDRKSRVVIGGGDLAYPANTSMSLEIKLYGTTPSVMENKKLTVMRIQDIAGTTCIANVYRYDAWVLNTTITEERITGLFHDLKQLRADAAAQKQGGADTSGIMRKIDEAQQSLDEANATPVSEFVSVSMALNRTESAIADGRRLLAEVQVTGTPPVQQAKIAATTQQTPASPEPVAIPFLAVSGAGIAFLVSRRRADR